MTLRLAPDVLADLSDEDREAWSRIQRANAKAVPVLKAVEKAKRKAKAKLRPALRADPRAVHESEALNKRQPRVRDKVYLGWVAQLPCVATLKRTGREVRGVHVAHVRFHAPADGWVNPGLQNKPDDDRTVPLAPHEHALQHSMNERAYWHELGIWPPDLCRDLRACFLAGGTHEDGAAVIRRHASEAIGRGK